MNNSIKKLLLTFSISLAFFSSTSAQVQTVKMYLMAGQSNMQGSNCKTTKLSDLINVKNSQSQPEQVLFDEISSYYWTGSNYGYGYDSIQARVTAKSVAADNLVSANLLNALPQVQIYYANYPYNATVVQNPKISSGDLKPGFGAGTDQYGPELLFGHAMANAISDDIILVKVAEGGSDLHQMWRSPSMEARLGKAVGVESLYPKLIQHATDVMNNPGTYFPKYAGKNVKVEVAGFVWVQGFNDQFDATKAAGYELNLTDLIKDVRKDMNAPNMTVAIGQSHTDGSADGLKIMDAQKNVANTDSKADWVVTNDLSNFYHYDPAAMVVIGSRLGAVMAGLSSTSGSGLGQGGCNTTIQAEDAIVVGGATVENVHAGYNGTGFVNLPPHGGIVEFVVQGCAGGQYKLEYRYALGSGSRSADLEVNGIRQQITATSTGSWTTYKTESITVNLNAGSNNITLWSTGSDFGNLDQITLKLVKANSSASLVLDMPRLWGEDDETSNGNTVNVNVINPTYETYHKYTDITHKSIMVDLAKAISSGSMTLSFKYIPTDSLQTSDIVTSNFLNISQTGNSITAEVNGNKLQNTKSIAEGNTCNHVVVTLDNGTFRLNHNDAWANFNGLVSTSLQSHIFTFGDFPGRIWDIQLYDGVLTDAEIETLGERCIAWKPVSNPPYPDQPYPVSNAYTTVWVDSLNVHKPYFEYYAFAQERAYSHYVFKARMYPHAAGLKAFVNGRKNRDLAVNNVSSFANKFVRWQWTGQHNTTNANWWHHECFHGHQSNPNSVGKGKWFAEASAEWAPNLIWPGTRSSSLNGCYSLHPHFPVWSGNTYLPETDPTIYAGTTIKDFDGYHVIGGSQYGSGLAFYYIMNIAANDPGMMGDVFNMSGYAWENIHTLIKAKGLDLKEIFGDFSARMSIWDYQDGSGPEFRLSEINSYNRIKSKSPAGAINDNKFAAKMDEHGTKGVWTSVPTRKRPGSWAFNAYKVAGGSQATAYKISLKGETSNPGVTQFQSRVVVYDPSGFNIQYYTLPVSDLVAQGTGSTDMIVHVPAGDTLVFTVASTPDNIIQNGNFDYVYDYQYKIEKTGVTTGFAEANTPAKGAWTYMKGNGKDLVVATSSYENVHLILTDVSGKVVIDRNLSGNHNQINLNQLNAGVYVVILTANNGERIHTQKIMKQ